MVIKSICVFCGSAAGNDEVYIAAARKLGALLAAEGIRLVYGGAKVGLMGALADSVLAEGGEVTGVIPHFLRTKEIAHDGLTELVLTETMHERKLKMHELSDGIITMPGGWGTMEELFEMLTWGQLGLHQKPIGILNTNGYYDYLNQLTDTMIREGFLKESYRQLLAVDADPEALLGQMKQYVPLPLQQWITEKTS